MGAARGRPREHEHRDVQRRPAAARSPPTGWSRTLQVLWHQGKGNWNQALISSLRQTTPKGRGCTRICIAPRATPQTPGIGTAAPAESRRRPLDEEFAAIAAALLAASEAGRTRMNKPLSEQTILVTVGDRRHRQRELARRGACVLLHGRDVERAAAARDEIGFCDGQCARDVRPQISHRFAEHGRAGFGPARPSPRPHQQRRRGCAADDNGARSAPTATSSAFIKRV